MSLACPDCGNRLSCVDTRPYIENRCKRTYVCANCKTRCQTMETILKVNKEKFTTEKPVVGINVLSGEKIFFKSATAAVEHGFISQNISEICHGLNRPHNGYMFRFANEDEIAVQSKEGE